MIGTAPDILAGILTFIGILFAVYSAYYVFVALFGLRKARQTPAAEKRARFALLCAARNEEAVIGNLVDSLRGQRYPEELFEVIVAPNNCTDNTRGVALAHRANIFEPKGPVRGKGEVLTQLIDKVLEDNVYDAVCVFDADNLVHPDFLLRMNEAFQAGAGAAQGFRDSKNPEDTATSGSCSLWYWMLSRFYNGGREALSLSCLVNGSGFMASTALLRQLGGWHTHSMTEDYEFTAQCLLAGQRVRYVPGAVIYDEQPLRFAESWKQRRRWTSGGVQSGVRYLPRLLRAAVKRRSWALFDLALTFLMPFTQPVSLAAGAASALLLVARLTATGLWTPLDLVALGALALLGAALALAALAAVICRVCRGDVPKGAWKGILGFPVYLLCWMPITLLSLASPPKHWAPIAHTRALSLSQMQKTA